MGVRVGYIESIVLIRKKVPTPSVLICQKAMQGTFIINIHLQIEKTIA